MLDFESCFSIEKLVIDNEICGMALRLIEGIKTHEEYSTKELLREYETSKQLLSHPSTRKLYRKEFYFPSQVIDRQTREQWAKEKHRGYRTNDDDIQSFRRRLWRRIRNTGS